MIVDHRTYNVKIGKLNEFLGLLIAGNQCR